MLKEMRGAVSALTLVPLALLVLVSVDLGIPGQPLLQSMRFHIAGALLLLVLVLLGTGAWRRALLLLLLGAVSVGDGAAILLRQQEPRAAWQAVGDVPPIRVISFNILGYNTENSARIADYLVASEADVVMLMEAGPLADERARIEASYPYRLGCPPNGRCDTVLLSKTPLEDTAVRSLSIISGDRLLVASTTIRGQQVRLVAAHLVKPYFDHFAIEEVNRLIAEVNESEGALILAGDFNAAGWSAGIDRMIRNAELLPGPYYPPTWPVEVGPLGVPIDNIFTRGPLLIRSIAAFEDAMGSNHRGLIAEIVLATPAE